MSSRGVIFVRRADALSHHQKNVSPFATTENGASIIHFVYSVCQVITFNQRDKIQYTRTHDKEMAQGLGKVNKVKKSVGSQKRKVARKAQSLSKGRMQFSAKGKKHNAEEVNTTKTINRNIESLVAAKAVSSGAKFFLGDVKEKGTKEMKKQLQERDKKQSKSTKISDRLKAQLRKVQTGA